MNKKPLVDVILISDARSTSLVKMTEQAIRTAGDNANVIVVESNKSVQYETTTVHPGVPFKYNTYLNIGAELGNCDYIFFGNNDLLFFRDWELHLIDELVKNQVVSASPICPKMAKALNIKMDSGVLFGYDLIARFCGWAFLLNRRFYDKIGGLDESFTFWCSDNAVVEQLIQYNEKHILVTSSVVEHINHGQNTSRYLNTHKYNQYTIQELDKFKQIYNKDAPTSHFSILNPKI